MLSLFLQCTSVDPPIHDNQPECFNHRWCASLLWYVAMHIFHLFINWILTNFVSLQIISAFFFPQEIIKQTPTTKYNYCSSIFLLFRNIQHTCFFPKLSNDCNVPSLNSSQESQLLSSNQDHQAFNKSSQRHYHNYPSPILVSNESPYVALQE